MRPGGEIRGGSQCKALRETDPDLAVRDGTHAEASGSATAAPTARLSRRLRVTVQVVTDGSAHSCGSHLGRLNKVLASLGAPTASNELPDDNSLRLGASTGYEGLRQSLAKCRAAC